MRQETVAHKWHLPDSFMANGPCLRRLMPRIDRRPSDKLCHIGHCPTRGGQVQDLFFLLGDLSKKVLLLSAQVADFAD